jgi:hypothetical protein
MSNPTTKTVTGEIELPRPWKDLVGEVFPENLNGVKNGDLAGHSTDPHDPDPHYDDLRTVTNDLPDGRTLVTELASGQGNYYAGHIIYEEDRKVDQTRPFHSFSDEEEIAAGGVEYRLEVRWTEPE